MFLDKSILIHASPAEVFAWLSPARMPRWDRSVVRAVHEGPLAEGDHFERVSRELGWRFEMDAMAVRVEGARVFAWEQAAGDFERHRGAYLLDPVEDGTRVHLVADVELPYVLPAVVPEAVVEAEISREADDALFNLKRLAEAGR